MADIECTEGHEDRCQNALSGKEDCRCQCLGQNHSIRVRDVNANDVMVMTPFKKLEGIPAKKFRNLVPGVGKHLIRCERMDGECRVNIPHSLVIHSPTGFEWGFGGSGPADLALNILHLFLAAPMAYKLHQIYKRDVIGRLPKDGAVIHPATVKAWIIQQWKGM